MTSTSLIKRVEAIRELVITEGGYFYASIYLFIFKVLDLSLDCTESNETSCRLSKRRRRKKGLQRWKL